MTRSRSKALAWALCALTIAVAIGFVLVAVIDPNAGGPEHPSPSGPTPSDKASGGDVPYAVLTAIVFMAFAVVGGVVASRRPRNPVGWCLAAGALLWALGVLSSGIYWHLAFGREHPPAAAAYMAWLGNWTFAPAFALLLCFVPLLFPTGAPPGPRWRVVGRVAVVAGVAATLSFAFMPGRLSKADFPWVDNPLGVGGLGLRTVADVSFLAVAATALAGLVSVVVRYRRARGIERLQLRWLAVAACVLVLGAVGGDAGSGWLGSGAGWIGILVGLLSIAVAIGVAMLRYRLYDLDILINRTLVYGALTATLAAVYVGSVLLLQLLLGGVTGRSSFAVAVSTLAVAGLFRPARARIQRGVDRRFFRRRYDARQTLEAFSARLRDEVALDALTAELEGVVADTMQPAHVSLWLREPSFRNASRTPDA